jgi:hypothetical protein
VFLCFRAFRVFVTKKIASKILSTSVSRRLNKQPATKLKATGRIRRVNPTLAAGRQNFKSYLSGEYNNLALLPDNVKRDKLDK